MKRIFLILISLLLVAATVVPLASCTAVKDNGGDVTTDANKEGETTTVDQTHGTPTDAKGEFEFQTDLTTLTEVEPAKASETVTGNGFTAVTSGEAWSINSGIDYTKFDYTGSGKGLVNTLVEKYRNNKKSYFLYDVTTGKKKMLDETKLKSMSSVLAFYKKSGSTVNVYIQQPEIRLQPEYKSIEGKSGYFIQVSFKTNVPGTFAANISKRSGSRGGLLPEPPEDDNDKFALFSTGKNGTYTGVYNATIPFTDPGKYYVNFFDKDGTSLASVPIEISESEYTNRNCHVLFLGAWDKINNIESYMSELTKLFYTTYPRLIARWGKGGEPNQIAFWVDPSKPTGAAAYAWGTNVAVLLDHANANPNDIGFFSHEITHSVQQYSGFSSSWWVENMANYGGFRYFHWSNQRYIQIYDVQKQKNLQDWGYQPYGDGSKLFFSYLDARWPTTKNEDGTLNYGLIDTINFAIKNRKLNNDDPNDVNSSFNKLVKSVTGFDCIESLRKHYAEECQTGTWKFVGFADYVDNFLTEDLPNVPNAVYPSIAPAVHGESGEQLATAVTEGDNLMSGATINSSCGQVNANESAAKLIDGNLATKWCATGASDASYCTDGAKYWVIIDLGSKKTFNTYTFYNTKTKENYGNMSEWEIFTSDDLEKWESVDYQNLKNGGGNITSFDAGDHSGRYVMLKVYNGDGNNGTIRLYEFQLYNNIK